MDAPLAVPVPEPALTQGHIGKRGIPVQIPSAFQLLPAAQIGRSHVRPIEVLGATRQRDHAPLAFPGDAELVADPPGIRSPYTDHGIRLQFTDKAVIGLPVMNLFVPIRLGTVKEHLGDGTVSGAQFTQLLQEVVVVAGVIATVRRVMQIRW